MTTTGSVTIFCRECDAVFTGTRADARRAKWEPFSTANQHAIDFGPMVCKDCVISIIDGALDAMRAYIVPIDPAEATICEACE